MDFGGAPFAGAPYAGIESTSASYVDFIQLNIIFPTDFVFFGEIGDIIVLPPDLVIPPVDISDRRSPCLLFDDPVVVVIPDDEPTAGTLTIREARDEAVMNLDSITIVIPNLFF